MLEQVILPHLLSMSVGVAQQPMSDPQTIDCEEPVDAQSNTTRTDIAGRPIETMRRVPASQWLQSFGGRQSSVKSAEECQPTTEAVGKTRNVELEVVDDAGAKISTATSHVYASRARKLKNSDARDSIARQVDSSEDELHMEPYLDRLREVLSTATQGLFSTRACRLLVELVVSLVATVGSAKKTTCIMFIYYSKKAGQRATKTGSDIDRSLVRYRGAIVLAKV